MTTLSTAVMVTILLKTIAVTTSYMDKMAMTPSKAVAVLTILKAAAAMTTLERVAATIA